MDSLAELERCDVSNKESLAVYRYLRRGWLEMLNGEDEHAICQQITLILCADLEFRTIDHSRKLALESSVPQSGMVHRFIDQGFLSHQVLAIRRLTETFQGQRDRAVYSLPRIVSEIQFNTNLITREIYVCHDGLPYDASRADKSWLRHRSFDKLSKVEPAKRSRIDQIHPTTFKDLNHRFKSSEVIRTYANKILAHAADPTTRPTKLSIKWDDLDAAYRDLVWVARYLSANVLYDTDRQFLPAFAYDPLEHIDQPICPSANLPELHKFWDSREAQLNMIENETG